MDVDMDQSDNSRQTLHHQNSLTLPTSSRRIQKAFQMAPPNMLLSSGRRSSSGMFISSMFCSRFRHLQKLHTDTFLGLNAVCLPGLPAGAVFRSSLPATPVATPVHGQFQHLTEQAIRERLCKTPSPRRTGQFMSLGFYGIESPYAESTASSANTGTRPVLTVASDVGDSSLMDCQQMDCQPADHSQDNPQPMDVASPLVESPPEMSKPQNEGQPDRTAPMNFRSEDARLFVGNISYRVKTYELRRFFKKFGSVKECVIVQDHILKRPKGYGFVTLDSEGAQRLSEIDKSELILDDRELRISPANSKISKEMKKQIHEAHEQREKEIQLREEGTNMIGNLTVPVLESSREAHINDLNDNCLLLIIDFVDNVSAKNRMERVCKRWQNLVNQHWRSVTSFNFEKTFGDFYSPPLTTNTLTTILKKCPSLKTIDLKGLSRGLDHIALDIISNACPNLETLIYTNGQVTNANLYNLGKKCPNLKNLDISCCCGFNEDGLWHLTKDCQKMAWLNISDNNRISGNCFRLLSDSLEYLDVTECKIREKGFTELAYRDRRNLKILKASNLNAESHKIMCSKLTALKTFVIGSTLEKIDFELIKNLKELEEVECRMFNEEVTDDELIEVIKHCHKLRILMFPNCFLTSESVKLLPLYCADLKKLCFSFSSIDDEALNCLANLESLEWLDVNNCQRITDDGILNLVKSCRTLGFLDLNNCLYITEDALEDVMKFIKTQSDRENLIVCYKNVRINMKLAESIICELGPEFNEFRDFDEEDEMFGGESENEERDFFENDDPAMEADRELT